MVFCGQKRGGRKRAQSGPPIESHLPLRCRIVKEKGRITFWPRPDEVDRSRWIDSRRCTCLVLLLTSYSAATTPVPKKTNMVDIHAVFAFFAYLSLYSVLAFFAYLTLYFVSSWIKILPKVVGTMGGSSSWKGGPCSPWTRSPGITRLFGCQLVWGWDSKEYHCSCTSKNSGWIYMEC